jgi:hypothetical protein
MTRDIRQIEDVVSLNGSQQRGCVVGYSDFELFF